MEHKIHESGASGAVYGLGFIGAAVYFYKDIYTEDNLRKMGLNERQIKAVMYVKEKGKITNQEYQELNKTSKPTATRELRKLVDKGLFIMHGKAKREIYYQLSQKGANNEPIEPKKRQ